MSDEIKMLPVKLTSYEKEQRSDELVKMLYEIENRDAAEKSRCKAEAEALKEMKTKASRLAAIVRTGQEDRPVMTAAHDNTTRWTIDFVRLDTGEVYHSRSMTSTEREKAAQLNMWVETQAPPPTEPGRNDPLPEAADTRKGKPKRGEPKTKADAIVADGTDSAALYTNG